MSLQLVQDSDGREAGIFIPIGDWKKLKKRYKELNDLEPAKVTKSQLLEELKEALLELKLIEQGKAKARPASELLSELLHP